MNGTMKQRVFIALILIGFCLPTVQMWARVFPNYKLAGVQKVADKPELNIYYWLTGSYQPKFESWFRQNLGMRDILIRLNNQVYYSFFHEIADKNLVAGKNGQLYEKHYILWYRKQPPFLPAGKDLLESKTQEIQELQSLLAKRGIQFLVLITPNKASMLPEYIPDGFAENKSYPSVSYNEFIPLLQKYRINYVDAYAILKNEKKKSKYPLFPQGGTHWTQWGSYIALKALNDKIGTLTGKEIPTINCDKVLLDRKPAGSDRDLADLLNLIDSSTNFPVPHPQLSSESKGRYAKLKILFEGGSFTFSMLDILHQLSVFEKMNFYFYYHDKYSYPNDGTNGVIDKNNLDWSGDIFKNDVIVLEINQFVIDNNIGSGFVQDAIRELKKTEN